MIHQNLDFITSNFKKKINKLLNKVFVFFKKRSSYLKKKKKKIYLHKLQVLYKLKLNRLKKLLSVII